MFFIKTNSTLSCSTSSPIRCRRKHADPSIIPQAAACCGLFCYSALSLFGLGGPFVASFALRLGVVRDDPMIPRTRQADATCGTASLSNYSASHLLEILSCFAEAANCMASLALLVGLALRTCRSRHIYLGANPS